MQTDKRVNRGFSLVEIAIVLVIIGFLLSGILSAQSVMRNARAKDTIKAVNDMASAAQQFHDRYGNWPGALQNAVANIPNLNAACVGNATGQITNAAESACASEELIRSSMLRGEAANPISLNGTVFLSVTGATVALTGAPAIPFPAPNNWRNVILIRNINCDVALQIERLVDDGKLTTGNFRSGTACAGQDERIPVPNAVLRLN